MTEEAQAIQIRSATSADAALVLNFIQALADYERQPHAVEVTELQLRDQLASDRPPFECLIAELAGRAVGFALFFHTYSTWRGRQGIWLEDLFVLPDARRHGAGAQLLARVTSIATERNCGRLEWSVLDWNEPALAFYERMGAKVLKEWKLCRLHLG